MIPKDKKALTDEELIRCFLGYLAALPMAGSATMFVLAGVFFEFQDSRAWAALAFIPVFIGLSWILQKDALSYDSKMLHVIATLAKWINPHS